MNRQKAYLVGATLVGIVGLGYGAYAQTGTAGAVPPRLIPFQGYLEDGDGPMNTTTAVTFFITDSPTAAHSVDCDNPTGCMWSETQNVEFSNGYFSVALGDDTLFSAGASNLFTPGSADSRYVRVAVNGTVLDGAQRLLSSPFAITAETAASFTVTGTLFTGSIASSGNVVVTNSADVRTNGGVYVGSVSSDAPNGTVVATADVIANDGMRVGTQSSVNPGAGDLVVGDDLSYGGRFSGWRMTDPVSFTCNYNNGNPDSGTCTPVVLAAELTSVCFLTHVRTNQTGANSDWAGCRVYRSGGIWRLTANNAGDGDVSCSAECIVF